MATETNDLAAAREAASDAHAEVVALERMKTQALELTQARADKAGGELRAEALRKEIKDILED